MNIISDTDRCRQCSGNIWKSNQEVNEPVLKIIHDKGAIK
jgi:hypothetical protein